MCILFFEFQPSGGAHGFKFVLAANRDEDYRRPSAPAAFWGPGDGVLSGTGASRDHAHAAGLDLTPDKPVNGTWLGITRTQRFAALTNFREDSPSSDTVGRGGLVRDFLTGTETADAYCHRIAASAHLYAGFSLLVGTFGDPCELWLCSNKCAPRQLGPGLYGLSNHHLDYPWPKVVDGKEQLRQVLARVTPGQPSAGQLVASLFAILRTDTILPPSGKGLDWSRPLCAICVRCPEHHYGTRTHTVVTVSNDGVLHFAESNRVTADTWHTRSWTLSPDGMVLDADSSDGTGTGSCGCPAGPKPTADVASSAE